MKQLLKKFIQITAKLLISGAALYYVLHKTDVHSLKSLILQSNFLLMISAAGLFVVSKLISAYRLNNFFRAVEIRINERSNIRLYWLGMFYNLFLPGGIGGDGYKVYYLNRNLNAPVKKGILAIVFDRITGLLALVLLCLIFALFIKQKLVSIYVIIAIIPLTASLFYLVVYRWFSSFFNTLNKTNIQSFAVQIAQVLCAWLILAAFGHDSQIISYLFVFLVSSVVAVIPFTVGGIGARELTFLFASDLLKLDLATSISLSLLFFFITALVSLFGIIYVVRPEFIEGRLVRDGIS